MHLTYEDIKEIRMATLTTNNKVYVADSYFVGCYECLALYSIARITDWSQNTIVCPFCNKNSVIPQKFFRSKGEIIDSATEIFFFLAKIKLFLSKEKKENV